MNNLLEIIDIINKKIESGNILWVFLFSILFFMLNFKKAYEFIEEIKRNRINKLVNAINCEYVDERLKKFLEHEIQKEYFRYVSGLSIERVYREKLLDIHEEANGEIPFYFFTRAHRYLEFKNGDININISGLSKINYCYNWVMIIIFVSSIFFLFLLILFQDLKIHDQLKYWGMNILFLIALFFAIKDISDFNLAKKIKKYLNQNCNS